MGFYDTIYDCGDGNYCVEICSSLDNFSSSSWVFCNKHKDQKNRKIKYNLKNFLRKFSYDKHNNYYNKFVTGIILDTKNNNKNIELIKLELNISLEEFNELNLNPSKQLYFSEFNDEPSFQVLNNKIYIIDARSQFNEENCVNSPICNNKNIIFDWQSYKIMILEEYKNKYQLYKFCSYYDFIESNEYINENYEKNKDKCFELIEKNILSPKSAFEFYLNECNLNLSKNIIEKFIDDYKININDLYDLPTDSHEKINILGSLCEYRKFTQIKIILEMNADPNILDSIGYTPFQSLIVGHSYKDTGKNSEEIKEITEMLLEKGANLVLEYWQYEEAYKPYIERDTYFKNLTSKIKLIEDKTL